MQDTKLPATERAHHPYSPSTTQTLEASPCWIPKGGPGGEAAARGTAQHDASEREEDNDTLSDEEAEAVLATKILLDEAVLAMGPGARVEKESYLPIDDRTQVDSVGREFAGTTGGYADAVIWAADNTRAHVIDWKFGRYAVEHAGNNTQGISYALGAQHAALQEGHKLISVKVTFFSPHIEDQSAHEFDQAGLSEARVRINYIVEHAKAVRAAIAADPEHLPNYHPTTTGCMFCGRLGSCPAAREWVLNIAKKYKPMLPIPDDIRGFVLTPKSAQVLKDFANIAYSWAREVNKRILDYTIENVDFVPEGYGIVQTFPRKIVNTKRALEILREQLGDDVVFSSVDVGDEDEKKSVVRLSITPAESAAAAKAPRGEKQAAKDALSGLLEAEGCLKKSENPVVMLRKKGKDDAAS